MFRTEIRLIPSAVSLNHGQSILTIGSCFAEVMGKRFERNKFTIRANPYGTIYNPFSICKLLYKAARSEPLPREGVVKSQGVYQHYDLHSKFGHPSESELWQNINEQCEHVTNFLPTADWVVITFGTAMVYSLKESHHSGSRIVANCHKIPGHHFYKRLLSVEEMLRSFRLTHAALKEIKPDMKFIVTVSPVRHIKETLEANSHSKALLRVTAGEICSTMPDVFYFPAFEIMMDDLRDYRFYEKDMIHPNETAHDYIWELFSKTFFTGDTIALNDRWNKLKRNLEHRPFQVQSEQHQHFLRKTLAELEQLSGQLDLKHEIRQLKKQLL